MAELLGQAELELTADLGPLDRNLKLAEVRVARSVAAMQKMLDSLHADIETHVSALGAVAAGARSAQIPTSPSNAESHEVWGVFGPVRPGSVQNTIVTVLEA